MINENILHKYHKEGFNEDDLYKTYKIFFGTLVSKPRLRIIKLLEKGKRNVSDIINALDLDQTAVSHNLARLKRCGFVDVENDGKYRYYKLNNATIKPALALIEKHMSEYCIHILKGDR